MVESPSSRKTVLAEVRVDSIRLSRRTAVLYAYSVKKGNFQSAAEAFAKHFQDDYLKKR